MKKVIIMSILVLFATSDAFASFGNPETFDRAPQVAQEGYTLDGEGNPVTDSQKREAHKQNFAQNSTDFEVTITGQSVCAGENADESIAMGLSDENSTDTGTSSVEYDASSDDMKAQLTKTSWTGDSTAIGQLQVTANTISTGGITKGLGAYLDLVRGKNTVTFDIDVKNNSALPFPAVDISTTYTVACYLSP
jgi:hypothetical protein